MELRLREHIYVILIWIGLSLLGFAALLVHPNVNNHLKAKPVAALHLKSF